MLSTNFLYLVPIINLLGSGGYTLAVLKGKARPNRVTWFMWALAPLIAFAAEIGEGVGLQSILTFMVGFGPLIVFVASFVNSKSVWQLSRFDIMCGVLSMLGLILWLITRHGNIAISLSIAADAMAAMPTVVKSWRDPKSESYAVFLAAMVSSALTLLTIDRWTFADWGFPLYILLMDVLLFTLVRFEPGLRPNSRSPKKVLS
jgi:hypothetical protein